MICDLRLVIEINEGRGGECSLIFQVEGDEGGRETPKDGLDARNRQTLASERVCAMTGESPPGIELGSGRISSLLMIPSPFLSK